MLSTRERVAHTALLIVDMQNDFVRVGAPLEVPDARATIPQHQELITHCRARGVPVVFTRFLSYPHEYLLWEWSPQCRPPTRCCWKGHLRHYDDLGREVDCSEVIDEISPEPGDPIVEKHYYGAFHGTGLDALLRSLGIRSLIVTGTVTQICVEETARQAFHHGYRTTMVADAVSSFSKEAHEATLANFARKFGWVEDTRTVLQRLS